MRVLITGIAGFVGSHFVDFLLKKKGLSIFGIEKPNANIEKIAYAKKDIKYYECNVNNYQVLKRLVGRIRPDFIIHLAAQASPLVSWKAPADTLKVNAIGQVTLFEAIRELGINPKIILAGSCEEYGLVKENEIPIKETHALRPLNTYAVSKVAQDFLGYQYFKSYGLNVIRTRPFHHTGPRRSENFVCSSFAKQIALIESKRQRPIISVGNLKAIRDFTDVRDMVKAYWLIMQKGKPGEVYNICSGKGRSIKEILDILLSLAKTKIEIKKDPLRMRPNDVPVFVGDCSKMRRLTGWKSEVGFSKTLEDLLNYWRDKV